MTTLTVHNLRQNNFKVRVIHKRLVKVGIDSFKLKEIFDLLPMSEIREKHLQLKISAKGGSTLMEVTSPDNKEFAVTSDCSKKDVFVRKTGLLKCLGRMYSQLQASGINLHF